MSAQYPDDDRACLNTEQPVDDPPDQESVLGPMSVKCRVIPEEKILRLEGERDELKASLDAARISRAEIRAQRDALRKDRDALREALHMIGYSIGGRWELVRHLRRIAHVALHDPGAIQAVLEEQPSPYEGYWLLEEGKAADEKEKAMLRVMQLEFVVSAAREVVDLDAYPESQRARVRWARLIIALNTLDAGGEE